MLHVDTSTNYIKLTRGDTAYIRVPIVNIDQDGNETEYVMDNEDTLTLTVRLPSDDTICFQKVVAGDNIFHIFPEDTNNMDFCKCKYDVQLDMANGDVFTVVGLAYFEILEEVTY